MATISGLVRDSTGVPVAGRVVRAYRRDTGALLGGSVSGDGSSTAPYDPHWDNVVSLLHFDGADGGTAFTDEKGRAWSTGGNALISTAQSKFGGASVYLDGAGDYLQTPNSSDFHLGNGAFAIECWIRFTGSLPSAGNYKFIASRDNVGATRGWVLLVDGDLSGKIVFSSFIGGTGYLVSTTSSATPDTWTHIAVTRDADTLRIFRDGNLENSLGLPVGATFNNSTVGTLIGCGRNGGNPVSNWAWRGWIDEFRFTNGEARETTNFTPSADSFPSHGYVPPIPLGEYTIDTGSYTGEVNVICLDDDAGTLENDLIHRAFPV